MRYREAVEQVIAEVRRLRESGLTVDEAVEQANFGALALQADYVYQAERAVRRVWADLAVLSAGGVADEKKAREIASARSVP